MSTSDRDVYTTAQGLTAHHGSNVYTHAGAQHQAMLDRRDTEGMSVWKRIRRAVRELQAEEPEEDAPLN